MARPRRLESAAWVLVVIAGSWFAMQVQRYALASYVGASSLMPDLGITAAAAGFLASIYYPVYGTVQIPSGILADQANPRAIVLVGSFLAVLSGLAFALSPSVELAVATRAIVGLTSGFLWMSLLKICRLIPGGGYTQRVGLVMGVGSTGAIVGLGALPVLLSAMSWRLVAVLVTLPTLAMAVLLLAVATPEAKAAPSARELWQRCLSGLRPIPTILGRLAYWRVFLPNMLWMGAHFAMLTWLPRYARDVLALPPAAIGVLPALAPLGGLVGNLIVAYIQRRRPALGIPMFIGSCVAYTVLLSLVALGVFNGLGAIAFFVVAFALGFLMGSFFISLAWIGETVEPELSGTATGAMNGLGFFPSFILPWVMGGLMDLVDHPTSPDWHYTLAAYSTAFWLAVVVLLAALVGTALITLWTRSASRRDAAQAPSSESPGLAAS